MLNSSLYRRPKDNAMDCTGLVQPLPAEKCRPLAILPALDDDLSRCVCVCVWRQMKNMWPATRAIPREDNFHALYVLSHWSLLDHHRCPDVVTIKEA